MVRSSDFAGDTFRYTPDAPPSACFCPGEHGLLGECIFEHCPKRGHLLLDSPLYEPVTRVPLLVRLPGAKPGRTSAIVQQPDLMPAMLDLLGVPVPDAVQGRSVASNLTSATGAGRPFAVSSMPLYAPGQESRVVDDWARNVMDYLPATITAGAWTLLYRCQGTPVELYDLRRDPERRKNVARQHPNVVRRLHRQFVRLITDCGADGETLAVREAL